MAHGPKCVERYFRMIEEFEQGARKKQNNFWLDKAYQVHGGERKYEEEDLEFVFMPPNHVLRPL
jgi:hypothetical protein